MSCKQYKSLLMDEALGALRDEHQAEWRGILPFVLPVHMSLIE